MKLEPGRGKLLIEPVVERKTKSGIIIPTTVDNRKNIQNGEVVATGKATWDDGKEMELDYKVGDVVYYEEYNVAKISIANSEYHLIDSKQVIAKEKK
ncbi:MAG: 10 kDa chaperonin [Berkelbacteria bacterium GW2011_GWA2_46_7]|uniref:10 kDa chaperonin n=1 Tax=Berkelbacteria bacterium GW2011_GWA2_46_7 TaxID=1618335 RepID=A0A0G1SP00_9BACT|nr:MAG: 10 kDa chaperonin [Berkelbacteria bacterium GW2011_GWA2_46_7]